MRIVNPENFARRSITPFSLRNDSYNGADSFVTNGGKAALELFGLIMQYLSIAQDFMNGRAHDLVSTDLP